MIYTDTCVGFYFCHFIVSWQMYMINFPILLALDKLWRWSNPVGIGKIDQYQHHEKKETKRKRMYNSWDALHHAIKSPDSKVPGANMWPIWDRQDPGGPHVGPMNFVMWVYLYNLPDGGWSCGVYIRIISWHNSYYHLTAILVEGKEPFVLHIHYYGCWWAGDARSQGICEYKRSPECSGFILGRVNLLDIARYCYLHVLHILITYDDIYIKLESHWPDMLCCVDILTM